MATFAFLQQVTGPHKYETRPTQSVPAVKRKVSGKAAHSTSLKSPKERTIGSSIAPKSIETAPLSPQRTPRSPCGFCPHPAISAIAGSPLRHGHSSPTVAPPSLSDFTETLDAANQSILRWAADIALRSCEYEDDASPSRIINERELDPATRSVLGTTALTTGYSVPSPLRTPGAVDVSYHSEPLAHSGRGRPASTGAPSVHRDVSPASATAAAAAAVLSGAPTPAPPPPATAGSRLPSVRSTIAATPAALADSPLLRGAAVLPGAPHGYVRLWSAQHRRSYFVDTSGVASWNWPRDDAVASAAMRSSARSPHRASASAGTPAAAVSDTLRDVLRGAADHASASGPADIGATGALPSPRAVSTSVFAGALTTAPPFTRLFDSDAAQPYWVGPTGASSWTRPTVAARLSGGSGALAKLDAICAAAGVSRGAVAAALLVDDGVMDAQVASAVAAGLPNYPQDDAAARIVWGCGLRDAAALAAAVAGAHVCGVYAEAMREGDLDGDEERGGAHILNMSASRAPSPVPLRGAAAQYVGGRGDDSDGIGAVPDGLVDVTALLTAADSVVQAVDPDHLSHSHGVVGPAPSDVSARRMTGSSAGRESVGHPSAAAPPRVAGTAAAGGPREPGASAPSSDAPQQLPRGVASVQRRMAARAARGAPGGGGGAYMSPTVSSTRHAASPSLTLHELAERHWTARVHASAPSADRTAVAGWSASLRRQPPPTPLATPYSAVNAHPATAGLRGPVAETARLAHGVLVRDNGGGAHDPVTTGTTTAVASRAVVSHARGAFNGHVSGRAWELQGLMASTGLRLGPHAARTGKPVASGAARGAVDGSTSSRGARSSARPLVPSVGPSVGSAEVLDDSTRSGAGIHTPYQYQLGAAANKPRRGRYTFSGDVATQPSHEDDGDGSAAVNEDDHAGAGAAHDASSPRPASLHGSRRAGAHRGGPLGTTQGSATVPLPMSLRVLPSPPPSDQEAE